MELILINENKLKITLSECDMKQYDLDCTTIDYDNTETRRAFWSILDEAKHKTGFDAAHGRVFIQLYPSRAGGCEMYVTKLESRADDGQSHALLPLSRRNVAYTFDSLDLLIAVCRRLRDSDFSGKSEAHRLDSGKYLLFIDEPEENAYIGLSESSFLEEFGTRENFKSSRILCHEHGICICRESAAEILGAL
jgi:negative regulator of genetic competence, sporulation and motility